MYTKIDLDRVWNEALQFAADIVSDMPMHSDIANELDSMILSHLKLNKQPKPKPISWPENLEYIYHSIDEDGSGWFYKIRPDRYYIELGGWDINYNNGDLRDKVIKDRLNNAHDKLTEEESRDSLRKRNDQ